MKKIGLLGGTFDPPHNGHLLIAYEVYESLSLDEVWFIPTKIPPHKTNKQVTKVGQRIDMLKLTLEGHSCFSINTIELEREGPSYTYDTISLLKKTYNHDFYFIIGGDMIEYLPKWYKIDELIQLVSFVGVCRIGYSTESSYPIIPVSTPLFDISSSFIRERIKKKGNTELLIPPNVKNYIEENGLYE
ncbi:nicotinate-nucleotide adenylyltransferase [Bacillus salitolerans]|uniref:Probable nicotinate-nucleotide adenylyltransferase n=1 Tax=Bacillus salitolerans TaxID=1437434 RepID=A0ABW4LPM9_9BACI